jgi:hypothetical protein
VVDVSLLLGMKPADLHFRPNRNNSEKNSEIFEFDGEIAEFCPKYANLISGTGDNSEITVKLRAGPA